MIAHVYTVAFQGIEAREVDVQVHIGDGQPNFNVVGLGDKAVNESRERVRAALSAIGLALPYKRITVNLAPADLPKEGSHYDLPIASAARGDGRSAGGRTRGLHSAGRIVPRCAVGSCCGRAARGAGGVRSATRLDLSCFVRAGSSLGRRHRDRCGAVADRLRQSRERRAGVEPASRAHGGGYDDRTRSSRT
jgi:hypothetical protein